MSNKMPSLKNCSTSTLVEQSQHRKMKKNKKYNRTKDVKYCKWNSTHPGKYISHAFIGVSLTKLVITTHH
jgi:hypothetical protein